MTFHPRASRRFVVASPMPSEFPTSSVVCFTLREERLPLRLLGYCPAGRSQADPRSVAKYAAKSWKETWSGRLPTNLGESPPKNLPMNLGENSAENLARSLGGNLPGNPAESEGENPPESLSWNSPETLPESAGKNRLENHARNGGGYLPKNLAECLHRNLPQNIQGNLAEYLPSVWVYSSSDILTALFTVTCVSLGLGCSAHKLVGLAQFPGG